MMVSPNEQIQIQYELSMAIAKSLDLKVMLRKSISTILRKINFRAGGVYFLKANSNGHYFYEHVFSIPRSIDRVEDFQSILSILPVDAGREGLDEFLGQMPLMGCTKTGKYYYVVELPEIGIIVLLRDSKKLDSLFLKSLNPIFFKLSAACRACLQNQELISHKNHLEDILAEKSKEIILRNQELEEKISELEKAHDKVQTLSGLLPICANCKKIRDDKGYWNILELYIQKHSKAEFSHGICPDCSEKIYGEKEWYQKMKKRKSII